MNKEIKIQTKVHVFDLTGGALPDAARKFCTLVLNYGLIRQYFKADVYDIQTSEGEQRESISRRVKKLRKAIRDNRFTPTEMHACALPEHISDIVNGEVTLTFNDVPLPVLNGFQRIEALEILREEGKGNSLERLVDNLPFPVNISLDSQRRKEDFLNLNDGLPVHKAHMLQLRIDTNTVDAKHSAYFKKAREIALSLYVNEESPFYDVIQFDQTSSAALNANVLMTERKTDQIMSFFGSARLIEVYNKDVEWYTDLMLQIHKLIVENTKICNNGMLLELPDPNRGKYKAGASFLIGIVNQFVYYMYLRGKTSIDKNAEKVLLNCVSVFDEVVDGDTSSKRRAKLMREFAQKLFQEISEDSSNIIKAHHGIPYTLMAFFSHGCFGVEAPSIPKAPTVTVKKTGRKKKTKSKLADVQPADIIAPSVSVRSDSDTSADWTDDI